MDRITLSICACNENRIVQSMNVLCNPLGKDYLPAGKGVRKRNLFDLMVKSPYPVLFGMWAPVSIA